MDTINSFTNDTIDTVSLPKFEEAKLKALHPLYKKIIWFNLILVFVIMIAIAGLALFFIEEVRPYWPIGIIVIGLTMLVSSVMSFISFRNRGFAFRAHDVIYRNGAIAIKTTIIPYNRVQHVAIHEGVLSRRLGLASVEIFTAGGGNSDVEIQGIEKEHAEKIKQLLVGKILKQDPTDGE